MDWIAGLITCASAFVVYWMTLYPGLGGGGDAAKFAFLGKVLGTAHPPGYPLYVLASYPIAQLPIGTLAFRINLLSAVYAVLAVAATYVTVRGLGGARLAAAMAGLSMAFGRAYWSKAILAEVYSLAALLAAAVLMALIRWRETSKPSWLFLSVALASLAFGNHLTVVFAVPAFVVYALLTDGRYCCRLRVLIPVLVMIMLGIAQYGFIILRTVQHAPYVEASATSIHELWKVVTARRYEADIFRFDWHQLLFDRVPMVAGLVRTEVGTTGMLVGLLGIFWLARNRPRETVLLGGSFLGILIVAAGVSADTEDLLVPAFVFVWPMVGAGVQAIVGSAKTPVWRWGAGIVAVCVSCWLPYSLLTQNWPHNDHSKRVFEDTYMKALFKQLPEKAIIPHEEYVIDQLINYELLGVGAPQGKDIRLVSLDPPAIAEKIAAGYDVFAFDSAREVLERWGMQFTPVQLFGLPLSQFIARSVRPGQIVALATTPGVLGVLPDEARTALRLLGAQDDATRPTGLAVTFVGAKGAAEGTALSTRAADSRIAIEAGHPVGQSGTRSEASIVAMGSISGASITVNGSDVARLGSGIALAVVEPGGTLVSAGLVEARNGFRVPIEMRYLPISRLTFASTCQSVGNVGWIDVSRTLGTGRVVARVDNYRPFESTFVIWLFADDVLSPRVAATSGSGTPAVQVEPFVGARARAAAERKLRDAGVFPLASPLLRNYVYRVQIEVNDQGDFSTLTLDLGGRAIGGLALATVDQPVPSRATLCSGQPPV